MPALGPDAMRPRALRRTARRQELRTFPIACSERALVYIIPELIRPLRVSAEKALSVFGCRLGWPLRIRIGHSGNAGQIRNAAGCWRSTPCRFWNAMRRSSCLATPSQAPLELSPPRRRRRRLRRRSSGGSLFSSKPRSEPETACLPVAFVPRTRPLRPKLPPGHCWAGSSSRLRPVPTVRWWTRCSWSAGSRRNASSTWP
jgi:hypothetical protein